MSALTLAAAATIRAIITGTTTPEGSTVPGLRTPLGDSITATIYADPPTSTPHTNGRLEFADMERSESDADLAIVIDPSQLPGIDPDDPEAWNVHMTLPTLLTILGHNPNTEQETNK